MGGSRRIVRLVIIALGALVLYLPGLGRPALWEPDEGRYAEIAREMYLSGDLVTPRDDFVRYFEKPPLVYWAETAALAMFGRNEFAVRLPAALFSAGQVVVAAALGEAMLDAQAAILAALALALAPLFFGFARFATLDPALAFFMTAALAAFHAASRAQSFADATARKWLVISAAMLALGTLSKGPVAPVLTGAIAFLWLRWERRTHEILRMPWIAAIAVYSAITIPWFALAEVRNPGFLQFFFIHEHVHRYLVNTEHGWGPWFFVPIVIGGMWPWLFFVPVGIAAMRAEPERRSSLRFLIVWFAVIFVFFSVPRAKLGSYILPAVPALAIAAGFGIARLWRMPASITRALLAWFAMLNLAAAACGAIALAVAGGGLPAALTADGFVIAALLAATAVVVFALARGGKGPGGAVLAITLAMVLIMGTAVRAREDAAEFSTYRNLAHAAASHLRPGCVLASYRHIVHSLPFYTGYREALVSYRGELAPFGYSPDASASFIATDKELARLWNSGSCVVVVANRKDLTRLAALDPAPVIVGCEGKKVALYNGPDAKADPHCAAVER